MLCVDNEIKNIVKQKLSGCSLFLMTLCLFCSVADPDFYIPDPDPDPQH